MIGELLLICSHDLLYPLRVEPGSGPDYLHHQLVTAGAVADMHVQRGGGRALFTVAVDAEAPDVRALEQQRLHRVRVAVEVKDYWLIGGKQRFEGRLGQPMRMLVL